MIVWQIYKQADEQPRKTEKVEAADVSWYLAYYRLIQVMSGAYRTAYSALRSQDDSGTITTAEYLQKIAALNSDFALAVSISALSSTTIGFNGFTYWISKQDVGG